MSVTSQSRASQIFTSMSVVMFSPLPIRGLPITIARQAHDGELQDQGRQDHHPPERLRGVDGHQAHPRRALSGGGRRGPERF